MAPPDEAGLCLALPIGVYLQYNVDQLLLPFIATVIIMWFIMKNVTLMYTHGFNGKAETWNHFCLHVFFQWISRKWKRWALITSRVTCSTFSTEISAWLFSVCDMLKPCGLIVDSYQDAASFISGWKRKRKTNHQQNILDFTHCWRFCECAWG